MHPKRWASVVQLSAVATSHVLILVFVVVLIALFHAAPHFPALFGVLEAVIILICGWPLLATDKMQALWAGFFGGKKNLSTRSLEEEERIGLKRQAFLDRVAGRILILAFLLQLGALVPLLRQTGGPIASPFASMAVAITVFAPFVANFPKTVAWVACVTAVYYAGLVWWLDDIDQVWATLLVNLAIFALAATLAYGDLRRRSLEEDHGFRSG